VFSTSVQRAVIRSSAFES